MRGSCAARAWSWSRLAGSGTRFEVARLGVFSSQIRRLLQGGFRFILSFSLVFFSRKGFFRWVHLSCSHESHYKVSLQGIIIMKANARSHCKESLQGVIARSHCKESLQGVIARSHCKESLQGVIARSHCKESLQGVIARSHESHCELRMESSASCKCKESSAIDLQGVKISS